MCTSHSEHAFFYDVFEFFSTTALHLALSICKFLCHFAFLFLIKHCAQIHRCVVATKLLAFFLVMLKSSLEIRIHKDIRI